MATEKVTKKSATKKSATKKVFWKVGQNYFIRTVTHYHTGKLVGFDDAGDLILTDAAWIADTLRYADTLKTGKFDEVEPYPDGELVLIGRGAIVDSTVWRHPLPREQQ